MCVGRDSGGEGKELLGRRTPALASGQLQQSGNILTTIGSETLNLQTWLLYQEKSVTWCGGREGIDGNFSGHQ